MRFCQLEFVPRFAVCIYNAFKRPVEKFIKLVILFMINKANRILDSTTCVALIGQRALTLNNAKVLYFDSCATGDSLFALKS